MSAHISVVDGDRIVMLTDGAFYDRAGILLHIGRKVDQVGGFNAAITTRGSAEHGKRIKAVVSQVFAECGEENLALETLREMLADTPMGNGYPAEMTLAIWTETFGPRVIQFDNAENGWRESTRGFVCEQELSPRHYGQLIGGPVRQNGLRLMEHMRQIKIPAPGQPEPDYFIGGQVDMTVIGPDGVEVETIHTWPDEIGAKLQPGANQNLNRKQRRAMARKGA